MHLLTLTMEASDSSSASISALTSLFDNMRHGEELANVVLCYLRSTDMIQGLKLLDAVGYRSIDSEGLKNLFVFNVIGGIFLGVGVERLSTHVDYDGTAQLEGISLSYFWLLNI